MSIHERFVYQSSDGGMVNEFKETTGTFPQSHNAYGACVVAAEHSERTAAIFGGVDRAKCPLSTPNQKLTITIYLHEDSNFVEAV